MLYAGFPRRAESQKAAPAERKRLSMHPQRHDTIRAGLPNYSIIDLVLLKTLGVLQAELPHSRRCFTGYEGVFTVHPS